MHFFEKERLIPVINDDGNIDGCIALLNLSQTHEGIYQISDDVSIIEKYNPLELFKNGPVLSISYPFINDYYQIDFIKCKNIRCTRNIS